MRGFVGDAPIIAARGRRRSIAARVQRRAVASLFVDCCPLPIVRRSALSATANRHRHR
ncbi:hypothetical protein C7S16_3127 [Burkholderia thailandensis]|uniref:Uncharacterized protein n=1 Tax=Burkholderia thailandensis TaxID=57975 RepID=A0AAW9D2W9_BURTH|nr:hypothetical protein [Burkholderia thailandensis]MDW9254801.1 hypothetical protein [Burkholderia thailandensis]